MFIPKAEEAVSEMEKLGINKSLAQKFLTEKVDMLSKHICGQIQDV